MHERRLIQHDYGPSLGFADEDVFKLMLDAGQRGDIECREKWYTRMEYWQKKVMNKLQDYYGGALQRIFETLAAFPIEWDYFTFGRLQLIMEANCEEVSTMTRLKTSN